MSYDGPEGWELGNDGWGSGPDYDAPTGAPPPEREQIDDLYHPSMDTTVEVLESRRVGETEYIRGAVRGTDEPVMWVLRPPYLEAERLISGDDGRVGWAWGRLTGPDAPATLEHQAAAEQGLTERFLAAEAEEELRRERVLHETAYQEAEFWYGEGELTEEEYRAEIDRLDAIGAEFAEQDLQAATSMALLEQELLAAGITGDDLARNDPEPPAAVAPAVTAGELEAAVDVAASAAEQLAAREVPQAGHFEVEVQPVLEVKPPEVGGFGIEPPQL